MIQPSVTAAMSNSNSPRIVGVSDQKSKERVHNAIYRKQKGLCRHCKKPFESADPVISSGRHRKYYHVDCAARLMIIETGGPIDP